MSEKLLPCPFCGGPAGEVGFEFVTCLSAEVGAEQTCPGKLIRLDVEDAERWNTRVGVAPTQPKPSPPFVFKRYIGGVEMAEGVTIERDLTLENAMKTAARVASRGSNGEVPVLVFVPPPSTANADEAAPQPCDPLYDSRNPNHGRSGGLRIPEPDDNIEALALADRIDAWSPGKNVLVFIARERRMISQALRNGAQPDPEYQDNPVCPNCDHALSCAHCGVEIPDGVVQHSTASSDKVRPDAEWLTAKHAEFDNIFATTPTSSAATTIEPDHRVYVCYDGFGSHYVSKDDPKQHVAICYDEDFAERIVEMCERRSPEPSCTTAICAVSPPSPDTVREKDRADLAEKHLNQIYDYLGCCRSGSAVICTIKEREAALSSAPVAGAWQEVLKPFADLADAMYVSGHCGGASPEDWPDKWPISTTGGRDQHMPQSQGGVLTVADFRKLSRIYHSLSRNDRGSEAQ